MAKNIEEFLREAARRRRGPVVEDSEIAYVEPVEADPVKHSLPPIRSRSSDRVHPSIEDSYKASDLGRSVSMADEKMESHLHRKFDHEVAHLKLGDDIPTVSEANVGHLAREVMEMLSSPQSIRRAIILAEVLERPEQRW